jgi:hypothetical protein
MAVRGVCHFLERWENLKRCSGHLQERVYVLDVAIDAMMLHCFKKLGCKNIKNCVCMSL